MGPKSYPLILRSVKNSATPPLGSDPSFFGFDPPARAWEGLVRSGADSQRVRVRRVTKPEREVFSIEDSPQNL
jgi:hypothetical protein